MPRIWVPDHSGSRRTLHVPEDVRKHMFRSYARVVAVYPKGKAFGNAQPGDLCDDTASHYNNILENNDFIKPHRQITKTWARHCTPREDFVADIRSTGQHLGARFFNRVDSLASLAATIADREPIIPFRRDRPVLKSVIQGFRKISDLTQQYT